MNVLVAVGDLVGDKLDNSVGAVVGTTAEALMIVLLGAQHRTECSKRMRCRINCLNPINPPSQY